MKHHSDVNVIWINMEFFVCGGLPRRDRRITKFQNNSIHNSGVERGALEAPPGPKKIQKGLAIVGLNGTMKERYCGINCFNAQSF